jgi:hypothetical protein
MFKLSGMFRGRAGESQFPTGESGVIVPTQKRGAAYAYRICVKKAAFRAHTEKNGFIRTTLCPIHRNDQKFGWWDMVTLVALIGGGLALARVLMAH